jgi:2-dehydropantoate 2-reductase
MQAVRDTSMKILVVGAGAIGSLFGAYLSRTNDVVLLGRTPHISAIEREGLLISGKTSMRCYLTAVDTIIKIPAPQDLILLTVKSYDTETAMKQIRNLIHAETMVITLQNGLGNVETMERIIQRRQILAGVTTHGVIFSQPGEILHTGKGHTLLGELTGDHSPRLQAIVQLFRDAGIEADATDNIIRELWVKAIINSSINPITAFFQCRNGYLLQNAILENIVEQVCEESTNIASRAGLLVKTNEMIKRTKDVIRQTAENYSSMAQSIQQGKRTEIDSINGYFIKTGKRHKIKTPLNSMLVDLVRPKKKTYIHSLNNR